MLQSLKLLQLSAPDLEQWVDREVDQNPLLERIPRSSDTDPQAYLSAIAQPPSFEDTIQQQIVDVDGEVRDYLELLIDHLDEDGFLSLETLQSLGFCADNPIHQEAYTILRTLHPRGLGATDLKDCLKLQLPPKHPLIRLLDEAYDDVLHHRFARLQRHYHCAPETLRTWLEPLKTLTFSPRKALDDEPPTITRPEIIFSKKTDGTWEATIAGMPSIRMPSKAGSAEDRKRAHLLLAALAKRQQTLEKIAQHILTYQREFLEQGTLHPQSIKQVAKELQLSPSTLSRAAREKYVQVQHRLVPLKVFFTHGNGNSLAPASMVQDAIHKLITQESPQHPLTDEAIQNRLQEQGIWIARRTVAKYRQQQGIPTSHIRKIFPLR